MSEEFWNYVTIYSVIYLVVDTLIFGFACSIVERNKGYDDSGAWFIWGALFGFIALIVVCAKPAKVEKGPNVSPYIPYISNAGIPEVTYTGIPRVFYCPNCNSTYDSARMSRLICPDCKLPLMETVFLSDKWQQFSEERKEELRQTLLAVVAGTQKAQCLLHDFLPLLLGGVLNQKAFHSHILLAGKFSFLL